MTNELTYTDLLDCAIGHLEALFEFDCGETVWKVHERIMVEMAITGPAVDATSLNESAHVGDRAGYLIELKRHTLAAVQRALDAAPTDAP